VPDVISDTLVAAAPPVRDRRSGWKRRGISALSVAVSAVLLLAIYRTMDLRRVEDALVHANKVWMVVSIAMILPITVLRALRFFLVAPAGALPSIAEALRLTLVASALNVFLPAKTGDLIKSYFVARRSDTAAGVAVSVIVYERVSDLFGLTFWCLAGWAIGRPQVAGLPAMFWALLAGLGALCGLLIASERIATALCALVSATFSHRRLRRIRDLADGWPQLLRELRGRRLSIVAFSLLLWLTHLCQLWMFTVTLALSIPFMVVASLSAIALMAGQLPFTVAGLGTRDAALVLLLAAYTPPEAAAAMGILIATRGFLPPLFGVPVMRPYLVSVVDEARRWRLRTAR